MGSSSSSTTKSTTPLADNKLFHDIPALLKPLILDRIETAVLCRNKMKIISAPDGDPTSDNAKNDAWDAHAGDICPAAKSEQYPQFVQVKDGYNYQHSGRNEITTSNQFISLYHESQSSTDRPQILFIKPPLPCNINNNYLNELPQGIQQTYEAMVESNRLTKELLYEILQYLPFKFPIFISCTSIYRGRGSWTHFTYPYTKSKGYMIDYIKQCGNTFDAIDDCQYEVDFYVMEDDVAIIPTGTWTDVADNRDVEIPYHYDTSSYERVWNEPILTYRARAQQIKDIIRVNDVGGSFWLHVHCPQDKENVEVFEENIKKLNIDVENIQNNASPYAEIGGSCGIKSRCWYQTFSVLQGKFLPMTVVSVTCGSTLLRQIINL
eukprot:269571_1